MALLSLLKSAVVVTGEDAAVTPVDELLLAEVPALEVEVREVTELEADMYDNLMAQRAKMAKF